MLRKENAVSKVQGDGKHIDIVPSTTEIDSKSFHVHGHNLQSKHTHHPYICNGKGNVKQSSLQFSIGLDEIWNRKHYCVPSYLFVEIWFSFFLEFLID